MHRRWRRFIPKQKPSGVVLDDGSHLKALQSIDDANTFIEQLKQMPTPAGQQATARHYRTLLLAQTPRAVLAQWQMDGHKHGYHDREKRLYELIDFNDSFVSLMLASPNQDVATFLQQLKSDMDSMCRQLNTPLFTAEQFEAITRGLGREITVYRAAQSLGFGVYMTSRTEDAFGIDMIITQPETRRELNIDCKTPSAFRRRLEELVDHDKITDAQLLKADNEDFITLMQRRGEEKVPVTLLCIRPETLGTINNFMFDDPHKLENLLNKIFALSRKTTSK